MKRVFALAFAIVVLGVPAVGASARTDMGMPIGPAGVSTMDAPFDQQFIDMMAMHHQMAIQMAHMALRKAKHPQVKTLARQIIAAQSKEIREFHKLRQQWYASATFKKYPMDSMMMGSMGMPSGMMTSLMNSSRFDYTFLSEMIAHHAGAITMANWELRSGTHRGMKTIAAGIVPRPGERGRRDDPVAQGLVRQLMSTSAAGGTHNPPHWFLVRIRR